MPRFSLNEPGTNLFHQSTIGTVPDEVLLDIFDFYREDLMDPRNGSWRWRTLVHVCRRWRHIVLTSPHRLDLRLLCTIGKPMRKYLDCWPPTFPIAIKYHLFDHSLLHPEASPEDMANNILVALENPDRVCSIDLFATSSILENVSRVMQVPFPALKNLSLWPMDIGAAVVSEGFLGGSAPGLQKLSLRRQPSSALPNFLLSCRDLVDLRLLDTPNPDHISPEAIVTALSGLSRLKILHIGFSDSDLRPSGSSHLPLHPRSTLSALSEFTFSGSGEYLEDLIARIDTPFLQKIVISLFHQLTDAPQLRQLICRTEGLRSPNQATIIRRERAILLRSRQAGRSTGSPIVRYPLTFTFPVQRWQYSSVAQFCLQSMPLLSGVKRLAVNATHEQRWHDVVSPADWLDLFRPFSAVEELYVSRLLGSRVALSLAGATGQAEILPALRSVFFEEEDKEFALLQETIEPFFAARRLSHGHMSAFSADRYEPA